MARPALTAITSQLAAWDGPLSGNFTKIGSQPFAIHESVTLTEANLAATFLAASYDRCLVWVNHTVHGYVLYESDGAAWYPRSSRPRVFKSISGALTLANTEPAAIFICSGSLPYTVTLPTAASMKGRTLVFKTTVTGTLTLDGSGAETIDGAATITITTQYGKVSIYSDGTTWHTI